VTEREQLEGGIAALESQRAVLGDAVVDTALAALRAKLARLDSPGQQLRPVTVLFADVVESTALSRRLDPEDVHAIMDGALQHFTSIVEAQHGRVLQYAGDGLLAVFGAVEAHEDDPERAVRAGLEILDEAKRLAAQVLARHGYDGFNTRVGIHTGPVLLGGGVDAEGSIRGIAVNIAARMEQSAPSGGLRISHTTYRHVRSAFEVVEEPPILVKGIPDPVRSYVVLGVKAKTFGATNRGVDGVETPLIGREVELARLVDAFETVRKQGTLTRVALVGDAGLGKTRLMSEVERWLERRAEPVWLFRGRAQPNSTNVPYGVLRALFGWRFEILDNDTQAAAHAKLAKGFGASFGDRGEEQVALIGQLIGLDYSASPHVSGIAGDGKQLRDRAFRALAQYFHRLHQQGSAPIVVLLDDLHWADGGSLDFIDHLAQACRDLPMMLLCLARPVLDERRPQWDRGRGNDERIDLGPLSTRSSHDMVESLLRRLEPVPTALRDVVTSNAEGNPYFVEELVAMLIDEGVIVTGPDHWQVVMEKLVDIHIPSTLAGVLQARLDALPPAEKSALQQASVIGHVFWDEPLQRSAPGATRPLAGLLRRDLVRLREPSSFDGVREFTFKHHLLHQVSYDSVLRNDKRLQHHLTAEWLVAKSGERAAEFYGLIADHYERATDAEPAAAYWRKAGEVAARTYVTDAALSHFGRALDLTPLGEPGLRYELIKNRVHMLNLTGRRREEESQISELERLAEILNDDAKRAGAASLRARLAVFTGAYRDGASAAARAVALAEQSGATDVALLSRSVWASALKFQGDCAGARVLAEELLRTAREAGNDRRAIDALHLQGSLAARDGRFGVAREYYGQALTLARAIRDMVFESVQLGNLGEVERALGNYPVAIDLLETGLQLGRDVGASMICAHFLIELAEVAIARGDPAAALALASEGLAIAREISHGDLEAWLIVLEGDAQSALGRLTAAEDSYHGALRIYREMGRANERLEPFAGLARVATALGRIEEGLAHVARVEAGIDAADDPNGAPALLWACHTVLAAARSPRANEVLIRAHSVLTERAELLDETDRATFLGNVPSHRAIMTAWTAAT
jgi:class 3 adenylate cyclase/tetratricopeptide (TPR) repeat protein